MAAVTGTILILSSINTGVSLQVESLYHEESWPVEFLVLCLVLWTFSVLFGDQ